MQSEVYRYTFANDVDMAEVESSMVLAVMGAEAIHGATEVRLKASHLIDAERRACVVDATTSVGKTLNSLFLGFIAREFGDDSFTVRRADKSAEPSVN
jgi:hypothetical protein